MKRLLAIEALVGVTVVVAFIIYTNTNVHHSHTSSPPALRILHHHLHPLVGSADGGAFFNPNCPPNTHWEMSTAHCVPVPK